jgi:hypothetical protein
MVSRLTSYPCPGVGSIPSHHRLVEVAIDFYNAGGERGRPRLEFHIADDRWTGLHLRIDFPVPPRGRLLLNVKINAAMLHERLSAPPTGAALLILNNTSKLFFQPCVLLLKGFDDALERRHIGRFGVGLQQT